MRRYSSFLLRRWRLPGAVERIAVEHVQSGERATLASLTDALRWIESIDGTRGALEESTTGKPDDSGMRPT